MPSFPDLSHDAHADADVDLTFAASGAPVPSEYVLLQIKSEGLRRRHRRHRRNAVLAALGLVIVAVPAIAVLPLGGGSDEEDVTVADAPDAAGVTEQSVAEAPEDSVPTRPSSTLATVPPSSVDTVPVIVEDDDAPVVTRPPATTVPPATTPPLQCRNSTDPACGDFRWDPAPAANQPLTAAFVDVPGTVTAGEAVTFFVSWSDPDATLTFDNFSADGVGLASSCVVEPRYGPWTPPDPAGGSGELSYTHTFDTPGEYLVVVSLGTGTCGEPYASDRTVELNVTVV